MINVHEIIDGGSAFVAGLLTIERVWAGLPRLKKESIVMTPSTGTASAVATTAPVTSSAPAASSTHNIWATLLRILDVIAIIAPAAAAPFVASGSKTSNIINVESQLGSQLAGALLGQNPAPPPQ